MLSSCVRRSLISCSTSGGANSGEPGVAGVPPSTLSLRFNCVRRVFSNATWSWLNSRKLIWYRRETPSVRLSIFNCSSAWRTCSLERALLRANLGLLLFALLQFSRKKKNSVVAIGFFTLHRFVISTGFFQLAARFFQRCSGVVAFVKQSVPLLADLRTLPVQVRHSRFAF